MKEHIIDEKEDLKDIGLRVFDYSLFEEKKGGGKREGLYGYPYLKHLIKFWPGDWVRHMEKINKAVWMKNRVTLNRGGKRQVQRFKRQELWKCIGCILSVITFGNFTPKLASFLPIGNN